MRSPGKAGYAGRAFATAHALYLHPAGTGCYHYQGDNALRIVFAGTPAIAAAHLKALLDHREQVIAVYTQPDRPRGRGKKLMPGPVKILAMEHGIPVHQPENFSSAEQADLLGSLDVDVMVVVAYGLILPERILAIPRYGCINIHTSLLPRWRGAAPIERAILAGDAVTGITVMQMDAGLDTGDILTQLELPITEDDNSATLGGKLTDLGCRGLLLTLDKIRNKRLHRVQQDDSLSTYAGKLGKQEALVDWNRPAREILRQVNAFYPRSPAYSFLKGQRVRIIQASAKGTDFDLPPGTIAVTDNNGPVVACEHSSLLLETLQLPGKNPTPGSALLNAHHSPFQPGARFENSCD